MTRPQFTRRSTQPMRAESYRRIARVLRDIADKIESRAEGVHDSAQNRRAVTRLLHGLTQRARAWQERHRTSE